MIAQKEKFTWFPPPSENSSEGIKLDSFLKLEDGWHYGEGKAPTLLTIARAKAIVADLKNYGSKLFDIIPTIEGEVVVYGYNGNKTIEIKILEKNNSFNLIYEIDDEVVNEFFSIQIADLHKNLEIITCRPKSLSALHIPNFIVIINNDFHQRHLKTQRAGVYPLLKLSAPFIIHKQFATTYQNFIRQG